MNIRLIGRSFKYHRPRGIYTCGIEEPNALVQILNEHNEPNTRATIKREHMMELILVVKIVGLHLSFDVGSINNFYHQYFQQDFIIKHLWAPKVLEKNL